MTANYKQLSNLDFSIGSNIMIEGSFSGIYDGNNCTINNLNYYNSFTDTSNYALFQNINNATIKNITLSSNLNVYGNTSNDIGNINFGGIVYCASNNSLIDNCKIQTNGSININGSLGLICNQTTGSNTVIKNCLTQYIGDIQSGSDTGSILAKGYGTSNTHVLYSTNLNIGYETNLSGSNGGIAGKDATVFGCLNNKIGNWDTYNSGGIIADGTALGCINAMQGNINSNNYNNSAGGIIGNGKAEYCINAMIGTIYGSNSGGISGSNGIVNFCLNVMKGGCYGYPIGGSSTSNNICLMYGKTYKTNITSNNYGISDFNFNNIAQLPLISKSNIKTYLPTNTYYKYLSSSNEFNYLPYLSSSLNYTVNGSNYNSSAPYWFSGYPMVEGDYSIASSNINYYGVYQDKLVKLNLENLKNLNIALNMIYGKSYTFAFTWDDETIVNDIHLGIGTSNTPYTFNVGGDLNLSGDLYDINNNIIPFNTWNIDTNGNYFTLSNIGISTSNPEYILDVKGDIRSTSSFFDISDIRLKENMSNETLGLDFIKTLNPKVFNYKNDSNAIIHHGFIAQNFNDAGYSNFLDVDGNGYYSLRLLDLLGPIVNAIKELE
jgi:hypothetical protein